MRLFHLRSLLSIFRSPALIGCFVVDRKYFEEIGLLDEGMEIYGGENVELGIRVRICLMNHSNRTPRLQAYTFLHSSVLAL